jgi:hypothetical protein
MFDLIIDSIVFVGDNLLNILNAVLLSLFVYGQIFY